MSNKEFPNDEVEFLHLFPSEFEIRYSIFCGSPLLASLIGST